MFFLLSLRARKYQLDCYRLWPWPNISEQISAQIRNCWAKAKPTTAFEMTQAWHTNCIPIANVYKMGFNGEKEPSVHRTVFD
jgi:hypothetical protein